MLDSHQLACMLPVMEQEQLEHWQHQLVRAGARRDAARKRMDSATRELQHLVHQATDAGVSQAEIARAAGIPRVTVRDWLGLK